MIECQESINESLEESLRLHDVRSLGGESACFCLEMFWWKDLEFTWCNKGVRGQEGNGIVG